MKVVIDNSEIVEYLKNVLKLCDDVLIRFDEENGMGIKFLDPSKVMFVEVRIPPTDFGVYDVEGLVELGVNAERLVKVLNRAKKKDLVSFNWDEDRPEALHIEIEGKSKRRFSLMLIEVDDLEIEMPDIPYQAVVEVSGDYIVDAVNDIKLVSSQVRLITRKHEFKIQGVGETHEYEMKPEEFNILRLEEEEVKSAYGLEYLKQLTFLKGKVVRVAYGNGLPLHIKVPISDDGEVEVLLAPMVED